MEKEDWRLNSTNLLNFLSLNASEGKLSQYQQYREAYKKINARDVISIKEKIL